MNSLDIELIIEKLPPIELRLETWNRLIKKLSEHELSNLKKCSKNIIEGNIVELKSELDLNEIEYESYKNLFTKLLSRLEIPIIAYKEKISEITKYKFRIDCQEFRNKTDLDFIKTAESEAVRYRDEYLAKNVYSRPNPYEYQRNVESFVTPFLFQPPIYPAIDADERRIRNEVFKGWDPNKYCIIFYKKLNELFKDENKYCIKN